MKKMVVLLLLLFSLLAWKLTCLLLRRRRSALVARLHPLHHCNAINTHTCFVEFPFLFRRSLEFGLFRTYAVPEISRILYKAGQFAANASKRYDDTDILVKEMVMHHIDGDRGSLALRRLNFIHSNYNICNSEFLYVLSIFILLPMEWCAKYGYRDMTEMEKVTYFGMWHDIGTRMGIRDIPPSIAGVAAYNEEYESEHMVYADSNKEIAEMTMELLLSDVPKCAWPIVRKVVYSFMDDRLRKAMGYPKQPSWVSAVSHSVLKMHGFLVRWMPPRPLSWAETRIPEGCPASQGAMFNPDAVYKLSFQRYAPSFYKEGYKLKEVGSIKPGCLGEASLGELLFPLSECRNLPWPHALFGKPH